MTSNNKTKLGHKKAANQLSEPLFYFNMIINAEPVAYLHILTLSVTITGIA